MSQFFVDNNRIGNSSEVYFIADIGASHDGCIDRAKKLITLAKEAGANAVKFQHFSAEKFVSDKGFRALGNTSHQSKWDKSVYEVYESASIPLIWTKELKQHSSKVGITFFSSPYGIDMIRHLDPHVSVWKVGSGDINYHKQLHELGKTGKPIMLATGASTILEVSQAYDICKVYTDKIVLMQCNTNYTGLDSNFDHINLNVLKTYSKLYPDCILGLSDHTFGHETVLGAVALGAKVIEKHFTDDNTRPGPDHPFSMNPETWSDMVKSSRILERSLGSTEKRVCENEKETVVLQRRSYRAETNLKAGQVINEGHFSTKRPCPQDSFSITKDIIGKRIASDITKGDYLRDEHFNDQ